MEFVELSEAFRPVAAKPLNGPNELIITGLSSGEITPLDPHGELDRLLGRPCADIKEVCAAMAANREKRGSAAFSASVTRIVSPSMESRTFADGEELQRAVALAALPWLFASGNIGWWPVGKTFGVRFFGNIWKALVGIGRRYDKYYLSCDSRLFELAALSRAPGEARYDPA